MCSIVTPNYGVIGWWICAFGVGFFALSKGARHSRHVAASDSRGVAAALRVMHLLGVGVVVFGLSLALFSPLFPPPTC